MFISCYITKIGSDYEKDEIDNLNTVKTVEKRMSKYHTNLWNIELAKKQIVNINKFKSDLNYENNCDNMPNEERDTLNWNIGKFTLHLDRLNKKNKWATKTKSKC